MARLEIGLHDVEPVEILIKGAKGGEDLLFHVRPHVTRKMLDKAYRALNADPGFEKEYDIENDGSIQSLTTLTDIPASVLAEMDVRIVMKILSFVYKRLTSDIEAKSKAEKN